jgi:hypothetical protein
LPAAREQCEPPQSPDSFCIDKHSPGECAINHSVDYPSPFNF